MQEVLIFSLVVLAIALSIRFARQKKARSAAANEIEPLKRSGAYHSVSIAYDEHACLAAKQMTGRRFLSAAAPRLPLPECNVLECRCHFTHHVDRRAGSDRRSPFDISRFAGGPGGQQKDRRDEKKDRRKSDSP